MKVMIIDDEYTFSEKLKDDISRLFIMLFDHTKYYIYHNCEEIDYSIDYDFAFIDIDLPDKNGIIVAEEIKKVNHKTKIVFVSSHSNLVHRTLVVSPFYFIRKYYYNDDLQVFYRLVKEEINKDELIELKYDDERYQIFVKDIIYIESNSHKLKVYTIHKQYYDNRTLTNILDELSKYHFVRIHRSYVINLEYLTKIKGEYIELNKSIQLKVGRLYKDEFNNYYKEVLLR